jgi:hypothetical protein
MSTTLLTLLALGAGNPPDTPPGPLQCPAPLAARGDAKGGPPLTHTFELAHRGPHGTLTITGVEAGCGCLRQTLTAGVLRPGETARLALEVNTLTQPDGPNRWQAVVKYRLDPPAVSGSPPAAQAGELPLTITATLSREVSVTPPQVGFSCTGAATQVLTVTDRRAKPLTVRQAAGSSPHLTAEVGPPAAGPNGARAQSVTLKLSADAPVGHRDEAVVLVTDDPDYPEFRVPVRVLRRPAGGVSAAPAEVAVRLAGGQDEVSTLVQLRAADGKPVGVAGAQSDHPGVAVKWSPGVGPLAAVRVTVTAAAGPAGACKVRVRMAEPAGQEVVVPVSWSGKKQ